MNRIQRKFLTLKEGNKKAFICYLMACDPDENFTKDILKKLPYAGCDIIELGMPFSDPMAEGITIQRASKRALNNNCDLEKVLSLVADFRKGDEETPVILMGYYNPILKFGVEEFLESTKKAGADGFIIVDLPFEEEQEFKIHSDKYELPLIRLTTPTTDDARAEKILKNAQGFVYHITVAGVTGQKLAIANDVANSINRIKKYTKLPVCAGFGIKSPEQAKDIGKFADGIVVGSALIKMIENNLKDLTKAKKEILDFMKSVRMELDK